MRQRLEGRRLRCRHVLAAMAIAMAAPGTGCAVSESDVHRWETTEAGPEKLYSIVTHDKYSWQLREEAAMSLVRMRSRNGKRVGLEYLAMGYDTSQGKVPGALSVIAEDSRRAIVDGILPQLVDAMAQPPPARPAEGGPTIPDPSIPYKDAAFALLSHEPPLATDEKTKAELATALTKWVQTDFETRIDNSSQQFGVEQIMRFLGAPAVRALPAIISESSTKVDRACSLIADIGDDDTKKRAGEALVAMAKKIDTTEWLEKQRVLVNEANAKAKMTVKPEQVAVQLQTYQEQELERVFTSMKRLGGRPVVEYCLSFARDKSKSEKMRTDALAAIENRIDKSVAGDLNAIFDILRDDSNPDKVRGVAMARFGELPKETIVPRLYSLFDKKWQLRLDAARMILENHHDERAPRLPSSSAAQRANQDGSERTNHLRGGDPGDGPAGGSQTARRAQSVLGIAHHGRQADRRGGLLPGQEVRGSAADGHRGGQDARSQMRTGRPVRMAMRRVEVPRLAGKRDEKRLDDRGVRKVVHRAFAPGRLELCKPFDGG